MGCLIRAFVPSPYDGIAIATVLFGVGTWLHFLSTAPAAKDWTYAYLIAILTFSFLCLRSFKESAISSLHRVFMIVAGGFVALLVKAVPTGDITARAQATGLLADALDDVGDALLAAGRTYVAGRTLRRLQSIDRDPTQYDDDVHSKYAEVIRCTRHCQPQTTRHSCSPTHV